MPVSPHPVTFTVYDTDGTTVLVGVKCLVRNCTKKTTSTESTTNSSGQVIIDLANLPLGDNQTLEYEIGDVTLLIAHYVSKHAHIGARYVVAGSDQSQTLYLKEVAYMGSSTTERIFSILASNTSSTVYHVKLWAFADCQLMGHIEVPANNSTPIVYGGRGMSGKVIFEIENKAIMVTANIK